MTDPVPLIGEPLAVDLVNTRPRLASGPVDLIGDVAGLRAWLALEAGRIEEAVGPLGGDDLAELRRVREHIAAALYAARDGEPVPPEAVLGINRALAAAPLVRELVREGGEGLVLVPRREGAPGVRLAALFAEDAAALLAGPAGSRVRACGAEDCVMLFVPAHPGRRWCSAARCGNRARVARYYQRHRTG
ncbi:MULTISPECIES: CGNR zinc finger domain-containing protein [Streptomyces]|uniref:CGNR zinc finger domain-containing protein n=1 Tax=Streptomyces TaxID=1883 RepID=UPI0004C62987|nr:CGNR zinc finger domain-containing protein [Streptomyces cyaneofuscatus]NDZ69089.1 CGNR zinc finger domain-containing protein [Streptomyces cyaneofuscatus]